MATLSVEPAFAQTVDSSTGNIVIDALRPLAIREAAAREKAKSALAENNRTYKEAKNSLNQSWGAGDISQADRERQFELLDQKHKSNRGRIKNDLNETLVALNAEASEIAVGGAAQVPQGMTEPEAERHCLMGQWLLDEETITPKSSAMINQHTDGIFQFEILADGVARIDYDDYVLVGRMEISGMKIGLETTYRGTADGQYYLRGEDAELRMNFDEVSIVARQEQQGRWIPFGEAMEHPKHNADYAFQCSDRELTLSTENHQQLEATYSARFVRQD